MEPTNQTHSTGIDDTESADRSSGRLAGRQPIPPLENPERLLRQGTNSFLSPLAGGRTLDDNTRPNDLHQVRAEIGDLLRELTEVRAELNRVRLQNSGTMTSTVPSNRDPGRVSEISVKTTFDIFHLPVIGPWDPNDQKSISYEYFKEQLLAQVQLYGMRGVSGIHYMLRCVSGKLRDDIRRWHLEGVSNINEVLERFDERFSSKWHQQQRWFRWESKELDQQRGEQVSAYVTRIQTEVRSLQAMPGESVSNMELRSRIIRGLQPSIKKSVEDYIGPKVVSLDETISIAKFYGDKEQRDTSSSLTTSTTSSSHAKGGKEMSKGYDKSRESRPLCKFFVRGYCNKGSTCRFLHHQRPPQRQSTQNEGVGTQVSNQANNVGLVTHLSAHMLMLAQHQQAEGLLL